MAEPESTPHPLHQLLEDHHQDLRRNLGPRIETEAMNVLTELMTGFKAKVKALFDKES